MSEKFKIFYSWQSDRPNKTNRGFIGDALKRAIKKLNADGQEIEADRDTEGIPGAPDIAKTIFSKIDSASAFLADVTLITSPNGKGCPNPNVLIELGYSMKAIGDSAIILVFNEEYGEIRDLPFDLRGKRVLGYRLRENQEPAKERQKLEQMLIHALTSIQHHQAISKTSEANTEFAKELADYLSTAIIVGQEAKRRVLNKWIDEIQSVFSKVAGWLRAKSGSPEASHLGLTQEMENVGVILDKAVTKRTGLGGIGKIAEDMKAPIQACQSLLSRAIQVLPKESVSVIFSELETRSKIVAKWSQRTANDFDEYSAPYDEMVEVLGSVGLEILMISHVYAQQLTDGQVDILRKAGENLHLLELTQELQARGRGTVIKQVANASEELSKLLALES